MGTTVQQSWPETIKHECGHCGATGPRLMCVEFEHTSVLVAICQSCAASLAEMFVDFFGDNL